MTSDAERALIEIDRLGILLLQDPRLPSLAALVAGETVKGSWWGHPAGNRIFDAAGALDAHADVCTFKLVEGKVCFVHRRLWPALVAIGSAREGWQLEELDADARALLERVERESVVRASGKAAKALETRLLAASAQVHTASGKHATELSSWARFAQDRATGTTPPLAEAKRQVERAAAGLATGSGARARLPWR
ncbi:MAG: hypothetical protein KF729_00335 [Sandaracinaceae bacterium]|nr:hypothetical protein [Sandaracinaceae bacterium]